ncbi:MAG: rod shape-determining protein RodA, partial [Actinobacteria bacterium]|nr:rod shape-determining protein RodA [Actinomycetota bacterium]
MTTDFALRRRTRRSSIRDWDLLLTFAVASLLVLGILLVYAATRDWFAANNLDPEYYLKRHTINVLIGILLAWAATLIDYRMIRAFAPIVWGLGVLGLILVLVPGIGATVNGARAWIALPGGFQIQPAELAKISIIVGMALILSELQGNQEHPQHHDVLKALAVAAVPILLIVAQPDLGTILIISASVVTIIAVSGAASRWVFGLIAVAILGGFVAVQTGVVSDYQVKRL